MSPLGSLGEDGFQQAASDEFGRWGGRLGSPPNTAPHERAGRRAVEEQGSLRQQDLSPVIAGDTQAEASGGAGVVAGNLFVGGRSALSTEELAEASGGRRRGRSGTATDGCGQHVR